MRCCRACREVITIGGVVAEKGNRNVMSDAGVAAVAAYAALRSAALNVFTNARAMTDRLFAEVQLSELEQLLSEAATATEASYEVVKKKLGSYLPKVEGERSGEGICWPILA